jgi:ubiquinone/menaquinone biosynthesis C-methylase UbiE
VTATAPVRRSKADARRTYDRRSHGYERIEGRFERHARTTGEALLAVQPGERVLEIGSGPGESLAALSRAAGNDGRILGLDIAPKMHHVAMARLRSLTPGADTVSLVLGDGATLPLRDGCFDAIFASFTLELFDTPELPVVLEEARRVLRPGGRVVIVALTSTRPPAIMERAYLVAHRLMPRLADCRPIPLSTLTRDAGFKITARRRCDILGIPVEIIAALPGAANRGGQSYDISRRTVPPRRSAFERHRLGLDGR